MAQTKSTQPNNARPGLNREQGRRGAVVGAGSRNRGAAAATNSAPARAAMPLAAAGGRRGRGNPVDFVRDVRSELRKVSWPTRQETINLTVVVLAFAVVVGMFLGGMDFVFQTLFKFLLGAQGGGG